MARLALGDPGPTFSLPGVDGREHALAHVLGRTAEVVAAEGRVVAILEKRGYADGEIEPRQVIGGHADDSVQPEFRSNSGALVRLGGVDLRDSTLADVRNSVAVVAQDVHLFHETMRSNLRFAKPDATDAELEAALRAAQIWDLVASLPDALDTTVGDRGYRLYGGEKQRIAIARLLLKALDVVVLDEATAHLDSESEVAVQRALEQALTGRTSLVIAHRLSTVRDADQIVVLDRGRVAEIGTYEELLTRGGRFAELAARDDGRPAPDPAARIP